VSGGIDLSDMSDLPTLLADSTSVLEIGTVNELNIEIKRETSVWREFSANRPGLPREVTPGLPTYELTLKKIMLNKDLQNGTATAENLMTLFGFKDWQSGFDILAQNRSLLIYVDLLSPTNAAGSETAAGYVGTKTMVFYGCWFDALPMKFSLTQEKDMVIAQDTKAKAAGMFML
jgi:hypothetical protein